MLMTRNKPAYRRRGPSKEQSASNRGFTLPELLVVICVIGLLLALLLPAIQSARESVRRIECANNMRQLALAAQNYHAANRSFPQGRAAADISTPGQYGFFAHLLPFLEQTAVFNKMNFYRKVFEGDRNMEAAAAPVPLFRCPSDIDRLTAENDMNAYFGWQHNNYRGNAGNDTGAVTITAPAAAVGRTRSNGATERNNGVFVTGRTVSLNMIADGASNTALFSEGVIGDGDQAKASVPGDWFVIGSGSTAADLYAAAKEITPLGVLHDSTGSFVDAPGAFVKQYSYAGRTYLSGSYVASRYNHVVPPNRASVVVADSPGANAGAALNDSANATTASSRHGNGVNVCLVDGAVRFVDDQVDRNAWSALGSIDGGEEAK